MTMRKSLLVAAAVCVAWVPTVVKAQPMLAAVMVKPAFATEITEVDEQAKDDLLAGTEKFAQGATEVTEVNLDKNMLGMVGKGKGDDAQMAHKMDLVVVHSYEYDKPGMYRMEDFEAIRKRLTDGTWSCSIHTKDKSGTTDICSKSVQGGETSEMVIMTAEAKEVTFVHIRGRGISIDDLGRTGGLMHRAPRAPVPPTPPAPAAAPSARMAPAPPPAPPAPASAPR